MRPVPGLHNEQQLRLRLSCYGSDKSRMLVSGGCQPGIELLECVS
jgi:hypothetical protein